MRLGGLMLLVSLVQVACSVAAVLPRRAHRHGLRRGRARLGLPPRRRVLHARGEPVRRAVADHADARTTCSRCRCSCSRPARCWSPRRSCASAAIVMALREDVGPVVAGRGVRARAGRRPSGSIIARMVPRFRPDADDASTRSTGCCASRSPASGWCGRSSASRWRRARFGEANADLTAVAHQRGPAAGADLPDRDAGAQRVQRRGAVVRRRCGWTPGRCRSAR